MPTVTVYIADEDTKLTQTRSREAGLSGPGHMWYELKDSRGNINQYGYAPKVPGKGISLKVWNISNQGNIFNDDNEHYGINNPDNKNKIFSRTINISQNQYNKMKAFGEDPYGDYDQDYNAMTNSCVDFVWTALEKGGLNPREYEGAVIPIKNIEALKKWAIDVNGDGKVDEDDWDKNWDKNNPTTSSNLGGSQQNNIYAIGIASSFNYTSHKKDAVAGYTLIQPMDNAINTAKRTNFNGHPAYLLASTTQPTCIGDAAGIGGGVKSGTVGKEVKPTSGSGTIIVEGKSLVRSGDTCTMNNANVKGQYILA